MRKLILIMLLLVPLATAQVDNYYEITLNKHQGEISLESLNVVILDNFVLEQGDQYKAQLIGKEILNEVFFNFPDEVIYDVIDEQGKIQTGGKTKLEDTEKTLLIPYDEEAQRIVIYGENLEEKLVINVASFSKRELIENNLREEIQVDPSEEKSVTKKIFTALLLGLAVFFFIIFLVIVIWGRKR